MSHPRLLPAEAHQLMVEQEYVYLDVRTEAEFAQGHPAGAYNVPVSLRGAQGMQANARFVEVVRATFAADQKLVIGCGSGPRSLSAAKLLLGAGFNQIVEQRAGFNGARDAFGKPEPGWQAAGLPVAVEAQPGRDYAALSKPR